MFLGKKHGNYSMVNESMTYNLYNQLHFKKERWGNINGEEIEPFGTTAIKHTHMCRKKTRTCEFCFAERIIQNITKNEP